jgi:hypothetical protein
MWVSWGSATLPIISFGLVVERIWPQASLLIFLLLYFVFLWIAWLLALKLTEPKGRQAAR